MAAADFVQTIYANFHVGVYLEIPCAFVWEKLTSLYQNKLTIKLILSDPQ